MPGSPIKKARRERTADLLADPRTIDRLCSGMCDAHTLADFCAFYDVPYTAVNEWIQSDDVRRKRYADALAVRETHQKDLALRELTAILQVDIAEAFDASGGLRPIAEMPRGLRRAIAAIETTELFGLGADGKGQIGHVRKLKFWSKPHAIELLMKHLRMITDAPAPAPALSLSIEVVELAELLSLEELNAIRDRLTARPTRLVGSGRTGDPPPAAE